jgi:hypothetical protein
MGSFIATTAASKSTKRVIMMSSYPGQTSCGCPYINHRDPSKHWSECHYRLNSERDNPQSSTAEPVQGEAVGRFCGEFGGDVNGNMWFKVKTRGAIPAPGAMLYTSPAKPDAELVACLKFARATMATVAENANLRGVEHRSLMSEVKRIDAKLAERVGSP